MVAHFDQIIFLIGTDCFQDPLFAEFHVDDVDKVKQTARAAVPKLVHGGDNYFMCADFSPARILNTQEDFFSKLETQQLAPAIVQKIRLFDATLQGITDELATAAGLIKSIAARMYWLDTDVLKISVTADLLDLITAVEPLGLDRESYGFEWEDIWLNSPSAWDQYVMSLMDGIAEVPYLTFKRITKFSSQFDFLCEWKKHLGETRFAVIRRYIRDEANAELENINPAAAQEINRITSAI